VTETTTALDAPFDHLDPLQEGVLLWPKVFSHREDMPEVGGQDRRVCVIGAGIAGLVAAYELARRQFQVTVLESSERCGGRIHTHYFEDGSYGELGAMRIPYMHSAALDYVEQFDLPTRYFVNVNPAGRFSFDGIGSTIGIFDDERRTDGASAQFALLQQAFPGMNRITAAGLRDGPRGLLFNLLVNPLLRHLKDDAEKWALLRADATTPLVSQLRNTKLREYAMSTSIGLNTADWNYLSRATGLACLQDCSVAQFVLDMIPPLLSGAMVEIIGGMELLPKAFLHRLRESRVIVRSKVTSIAVSEKVSVSWRTGRDGNARELFDYVVVAVPPPALRKLNFECAHALDEKVAAISATKMGPLAKSLLHCRERFWEVEPLSIFGGLSFTNLSSQQCWYPSDNSLRYRDNSGRSRYRARNPDLSRRPGVLTASYLWGPSARKFARIADEAKTKQVIADLAALHQLDPEFVERQVLSSVHKYWADGFTLLDTSHYRHLGAPLRDAAHVARVFFAGEHVSMVHGWMISAIVSALAAVRHVLEANARWTATQA